MSYKSLEGFQKVSFKSERDGAFKDLVSKLPLLSAVSADNATFIFKIVHTVGSRLYLTAVEETRKTVSGEELRFIFSLTTGQYALVARVESSTGVGSVLIDYDVAELLRLQRRDSFRINVPPSVTFDFYLNSKMTQENAWKVADCSLGGAALRVPKDLVSSYWVGSSIKGSLVLHGRDPMVLEGVVRHHFPKDSGPTQKIGIQFVNLTPDQIQEMHSLTLQLHRETKS